MIRISMFQKEIYRPQDIEGINHSFSGKLYGSRRTVEDEVLKGLDADG